MQSLLSFAYFNVDFFKTFYGMYRFKIADSCQLHEFAQTDTEPTCNKHLDKDRALITGNTEQPSAPHPHLLSSSHYTPARVVINVTSTNTGYYCSFYFI